MLPRYTISYKRWKEMKEIVKNVFNLCVFISLVNLPFITVTQLISTDTFLDSFENPDFYLYLQSGGYSMEPDIKEEDYILLQKSSHPDFNIQVGDVILYCKDNGEIACNRIRNINGISSVKRYHIIDDNGNLTDKHIYGSQIIGKIVSVVNTNLWDVISMKIWDMTIHNLNVRALFTNH
jgi:hypothetical protein